MLPDRFNVDSDSCGEDLAAIESMRAMALTRPGAGKVEAVDLDLLAPSPWEVLVRVLACGVCRTDLHVVVP